MGYADEPPGRSHSNCPKAPPGSVLSPATLQSITLRELDMDIDNASDTGTQESLTDSTYEIISAANTRSSDDEDSQHDDTDSLLSFNDDGPQEERRLRLREYISPEASRAITPAPDSTDDEAEPPKPEVIVPPTPELEYSEITEGTALQTPRASTSLDSAALEAADSATEISRTIDSSTIFTEHGVKLERCRVSVQQTLAPFKFDAGPIFRILWHGDLTGRDEVIEKIAQALAVSMNTDVDSSIMKESSSKFSIVQISSFGQHTKSPHVTLIPTGKTEVVVDTCGACSTGQHHEARVGVIPDLEVFFHSEGYGWHRQFESAQMLCEGPFLDIRPTSREFPLENFQPYHGKAVHVTVDADIGSSARRMSSSSRTRRVPIDLKQFQQLDAEMLNRNLRCLHDTALEEAKLWRSPLKVHALAASVVRTASAEPFKTWLSRAVIALLAYLITTSMVALSYPKHDGRTVESTQSLATVTVTSTVQSTVMSDTSDTSDASDGPRVTTGLSKMDSVYATPVLTAASDADFRLEGPYADLTRPFELLQTSLGKFYLKLPHDMPKLRRPPPIHIDVDNGGRSLTTTLSKWNATVYSIELEGYDPLKLLQIVITSGKTGIRYQTLTVPPEHRWHRVRTLESGLSACLETTKDVARMARKELGLFRDQASGLIMSSTEWLQEQMKTARQSGNNAAGDIWERLSSRRDVLAKQANGANQDILHNANKHAETISSTLNRHASALIQVRQEIQSVVTKNMRTARKQLSELEENLGRAAGWEHCNPLKEASRRAEILKEKATAKIAARRKARHARKLASHLSREGQQAVSRKSQRRQEWCAKAGKARAKFCQRDM